MAAKWLPDEPLNQRTLGRALYLDNNYWDRMQDAVANGIAQALNGNN